VSQGNNSSGAGVMPGNAGDQRRAGAGTGAAGAGAAGADGRLVLQ
jgi:hypothetical protein